MNRKHGVGLGVAAGVQLPLERVERYDFSERNVQHVFKMQTQWDPQITLLGIYLKEATGQVASNNTTTCVSALVTMWKGEEHTYPVVGNWLNKSC